MIFLWLAIAAFQQTPMVEVTREERIELTADQRRVFEAISRFGSSVGRCRRHMPEDQVTAFEAGVASVPPAGQPGGPSILDQIFSISYQQGAQSAEARTIRRDRCEVMVEDAGAMLVGAEGLIPAVEADMPPVSARPWAGFVPASARAPGRAPRAVEPLRGPGPDRVTRPNAVSTRPGWAETPRLAMPAAARNLLSEGAAHIECIVTVEGRARACQLLRESIEGMGLGEAALKAEDTYRFHPGTIDGQPVETRAAFTIRFRNEDRVIQVQ